MTTRISAPRVRHESAERALAQLGSHRSDHQVLSLQCRNAHHLAAVYRTKVGLVFVSRTGSHSHGSRDFVDTGHHGHRAGREYVEFLDGADPAYEMLPGWCDCGPRSVSRDSIRDWMAEGRRTVRVM